MHRGDGETHRGEQGNVQGGQRRAQGGTEKRTILQTQEKVGEKIPPSAPPPKNKTQVESVQLEKTLDLKLKFHFQPPQKKGLSVVRGQGSIVQPERSLHIKLQPPTQPRALRKVCCGRWWSRVIFGLSLRLKLNITLIVYKDVEKSLGVCNPNSISNIHVLNFKMLSL